MFNFYNLFSSSSGNCSYIETESTKLLIDCGLSAKKIEESLKQLNSSLSKINGILITHEHSDHTKALKTICKNYDIPVYANKKTHDAISKTAEISNKKYFLNDEAFDLGELKIKPFSIPHDAADPVAYNIANAEKKISIATDIGHIDKNLVNNLVGSNFILLESNYDFELLKNQISQIQDEKILKWQDWTRYSSRQDQKMKLGGVVGKWQFKKLSPELSQLLYIGQWLHCGKNATFGLGKYKITNL